MLSDNPTPYRKSSMTYFISSVPTTFDEALATDYDKEVIKVNMTDKLKMHLSPGGGWAARIEKDN